MKILDWEDGLVSFTIWNNAIYWNVFLNQGSYQLFIFPNEHSSNNTQFQWQATTCVEEQIKYQKSNILDVVPSTNQSQKYHRRHWMGKLGLW